MTRLLDNLYDDQQARIFWLMDQWRSRENATDLDHFQVGQKIQEGLMTNETPFSMVAYEKFKGNPKGGAPTGHNACGYTHKALTAHSWADCICNPAKRTGRPNFSPNLPVETEQAKGQEKASALSWSPSSRQLGLSTRCSRPKVDK